MTENEAINTLQYLLGYENAVDNGELDTPNNLNSQEKEALRMILEEIQQYRAIGTVESLKNLPAICDSLAESVMKAEKLIEELQAYRAIGTVEEFKAFKLGRLGNKGFITIGQTMEEYAQKIRENAIDDFAEKLNTDVESFVAEVDGVRADLLTLDYFSEFVFEVSEELKGVQE